MMRTFQGHRNDSLKEGKVTMKRKVKSQHDHDIWGLVLVSTKLMNTSYMTL